MVVAAAKKILQSNYSKHSATVTRGRDGGLGMAIEHEGASHLAAVRVGTLIGGKPVAESGLVKEGDLIVEINGHSTLGVGFDEIVGFLAGKPGDDISMKLRRCNVKHIPTWKNDSEKNWFVGDDGTLAPWFRDCPEKSVLVQASRANDPIAKATTALMTSNLSPELKHLLTTMSKELTQLLPKEAAKVRRSWHLSSEGEVAAPSSYSPKEDAMHRRRWQLSLEDAA